MKKNQELMRLGPSIKLLKRHVWEWNALLSQQKQVRFLTRENVEQQAQSPTDSRITAIQHITNQGIRLNQVMTRQTQKRHQMRARHQREVLALEEVFNTHNGIQTETLPNIPS